MVTNANLFSLSFKMELEPFKKLHQIKIYEKSLIKVNDLTLIVTYYWWQLKKVKLFKEVNFNSLK